MRAGSAKQRRMRTDPIYFLFLFPGLVYLIVNNYLPMFGVFLAFKSINFSKGIFGSPWVGMKNFQFLFRTSDAFIMIRNTVGYNLIFMTLGTAIAITLAIMLCELRGWPSVKLFQGILLVPYLLSWIIVSYIVYAFLSSDTGLINGVLRSLGYPIVQWYAKPNAWIVILVLVNTWKTMGYSTIVYMANIAGIDRSLYEAAMIDGAGKWTQIRYITLPLLRPTVITMLLLSAGRIIYSDFGLFYQVTMNSGMLYSTTQTIDTYVYRALMQLNSMEMASAAGLFQAVVGFVVVLSSNLLVRRVDPDNALF